MNVDYKRVYRDNNLSHQTCLKVLCLLVSQPASNVFLSHRISISYQPPASRQYFSLTTNQHQPQPVEQSEKVADLSLWNI